MIAIDELKSRLRSSWMSGDYDRFSRFLEKEAVRFFWDLNPKPGSRLLDVGCGSGQSALIAARAGLRATGCDIAPNWIEKARARAQAEGLPAVFDEGDAEALPYMDARFDVVVSLIGAMFAPRPELVAAELTRVARPGGTIAMANWTPAGFVGKMFQVISQFIAPNGMPAPTLWGDEATVRGRLREGIEKLTCTPKHFNFRYPFGPGDVVEFFRVNYGPMSRAFASLDGHRQEKLRRELISLWARHNRASDNGTLVEAEYLEVVATRA
jgi:SAM-dependent methyltransferase